MENFFFSAPQPRKRYKENEYFGGTGLGIVRESMEALQINI